MKVTPIIGLEVHVELKTKSKMFCGCDSEHFHAEPNTHTCPVCLGLPGALPVPNKTACEWDIKLGLALGCVINQLSFFERKNYFYPDLAKSYQITQLQKPFAVHGQITVDGEVIRINRAHMEEDTGKSQHQIVDFEDVTLIDFNRAGVPLVEIVSEPDIHSSLTAKNYLLKIQQLIRYLGISDADIEKGSMRCEPTVNLQIDTGAGQTVYTPLAEIKNVASLTGAQNAIDYEIDRQLKAWQSTGEVKNNTNKTTRGWDAQKNQTFLQREKEGSADYRYFPEPDIPPIEFSLLEIEKIRQSLPELPHQKIARYLQWGLDEYNASLIAADSTFARGFELLVEKLTEKSDYRTAANLYNGALRQYLNESQSDLDLSKLSSKFTATIIAMINSQQISASAAKIIFVVVYETGSDPEKIAREKGLLQVSDTSQLETFARQVIEANSKAVADYKKNPASIGYLVGQLMRLSGGSANPQLAKEILEKLLSQS